MNGGLSMVEMKSGYKMTEVGVIPEDWVTYTDIDRHIYG